MLRAKYIAKGTMIVQDRKCVKGTVGLITSGETKDSASIVSCRR